LGWSDHLPDPDRWEEAIEAMADRADLERKAARERGERNPYLPEPVPVEIRCQHGGDAWGCILEEGHDGGHWMQTKKT